MPRSLAAFPVGVRIGARKFKSLYIFRPPLPPSVLPCLFELECFEPSALSCLLAGPATIAFRVRPGLGVAVGFCFAILTSPNASRAVMAADGHFIYAA